MRLLSLFVGMLLLLLSSSTVLGADKATYPYEAIVDLEDGEDVWSGHDTKKHYRTSHLAKGEKVTVVRTEHGGWCMIEPPAGSHGWIRADMVERQDEKLGTISAKRAKVQIGSDVTPDSIGTYQAELSMGEPIEILDERDFTIDGTRQRMLKINPVAKREWRWIRRNSIVAVDAIKPFPIEETVPKLLPDQTSEGNWDEVALPKSLGSIKQERKPLPPKRERETKPQRADEPVEQPGKERLTEVDREFRDMIKADRETWNLEAIEDQYLQLGDDVESDWMKGQLAGRFEAIKRYRKMYNEYAEFLKIMSEAKRRDEQLRFQQVQYQQQITDRTPRNGVVQASASAPANESSNSTATPTAATATQPSNTPAASASQPTAAAGATPAFDGAGIVKKLAQSFPGGPQYVLITPEGKALTFLEPTAGVDLDRHDGKAMGIIGHRFRREDWTSDVITVRSLRPVQLRKAETTEPTKEASASPK